MSAEWITLKDLQRIGPSRMEERVNLLQGRMRVQSRPMGAQEYL